VIIDPEYWLITRNNKSQKIADAVLEEAGLFSKGREFFSDRIMIPIRDAVGAGIGFSARKYKLDTFVVHEHL